MGRRHRIFLAAVRPRLALAGLERHARGGGIEVRLCSRQRGGRLMTKGAVRTPATNRSGVEPHGEGDVSAAADILKAEMAVESLGALVLRRETKVHAADAGGLERRELDFDHPASPACGLRLGQNVDVHM